MKENNVSVNALFDAFDENQSSASEDERVTTARAVSEAKPKKEKKEKKPSKRLASNEQKSGKRTEKVQKGTSTKTPISPIVFK